MQPTIRALLFALVAGSTTLALPATSAEQAFGQSPDALLAGETLAVGYSGFREGQHPDRGAGAVNPSREQVLEDLRILERAGFRLIRVYDAGANSAMTLELIREHALPIQVLLGAWLDAELSNHEGCPWLDAPIPPKKLAENRRRNEAEIERVIELARAFPEIVVAVNVGNEALVDWTDHLVPIERVIGYVREVRDAIAQPVTVAENYAWWAAQGAELGAELDFIGIHSYPIWEEKDIDAGLAYTIANVAAVAQTIPGKPLALLEAGWATTAVEFGERAGEDKQLRYLQEISAWAEESNTTVFFFEAFDEPWKGDPDQPLGAEKHWGLYFVDRSPKQAVRALPTREAPGRSIR